MANDHPFQILFETLGRLPAAHAESVNRHAYEILYDILSVPVEKPGRCILLRAPRAGHGKTHLLSRIQHHLGSSHEFIPLHAAFGCQIDASTVIDDALRRLLRPLPASGGLCVLDLVARRLFASALQPLVGSGEVPCQDREGALAALRTRPIETFDFHHPNAVTAHWARENFEVLGQRLSIELAQRCGLAVREVAFWVDVLFRFAATPVENPARLKALAEAVHVGAAADSVLMERLEALLGLLAQLMRVVLVADDLEGFSTDESAALKLAAFLGSLRQSVERLDVILSLNQDIWESAFIPRLSGGLADRLSEVVVELQPLNEDEMVALLESRVPGLGSRVLAKVDRAAAGTHARGLIRAAGLAWLRATAMDKSPQPAAAPATAAVAGVFEAPPVALELAPVFQAAPLIEAAVSPPEVVVSPPEVLPVAPPATVAGVFETPPAGLDLAPVFQAAPPVEATFAPPEVAVAEAPAAVEVKPEAQPVSTPPVERVPDPTLAIAFLAAEGHKTGSADSWPEPGFSAVSEVATPVGPANPGFAATATDAAATAPAVAAEAPVLSAEAAPPIETAPPVAPVFEPAADFQPASFDAFRVEPENRTAPDFTALAEPATALPQVEPAGLPEQAFQPVVEPAPQPVPSAVAPEEVKVPDTDRVDDLLRQFRERYGRSSL